MSSATNMQPYASNSSTPQVSAGIDDIYIAKRAKNATPAPRRFHLQGHILHSPEQQTQTSARLSSCRWFLCYEEYHRIRIQQSLSSCYQISSKSQVLSIVHRQISKGRWRFNHLQIFLQRMQGAFSVIPYHDNHTNEYKLAYFKSSELCAHRNNCSFPKIELYSSLISRQIQQNKTPVIDSIMCHLLNLDESERSKY